MKNYNKLTRNSLLLLLLPSITFAVEGVGKTFDLTKTLIGATGYSQVSSPDFGVADALGEDVAGTLSNSAHFQMMSGYFSAFASGSTGQFALLNATVGTSKILQNGLQVGVPLTASVQLDFSAQVNPASIPTGIQVFLIMDHLGQTQNQLLASTFSYTGASSTVTVYSAGLWPGNSLIDVVATTQLLSVDGFVLGQQAHARFITVLDPHQENVVLNPIPIPGVLAAGSANSTTLNIDIPSNSFSNYSYVLVSQDPLNSPLLVNPTVLQAANQRSVNSGGAYQTPLLYEEIAAFNEQGQPMSLGKAANLSITSIGSGVVGNSPVPIRIQTLSLWNLNTAQSLWVKMPDTHPNLGGASGEVTQFSVYALMGSADGDASAVYVYPLPWRPHGPNAGVGSGLSGTDPGGITFSNLPSECDVKVYTVSGDLVWSTHHSDLTGPLAQQVWDVNTSGGDHVASGVYLWRVESSLDSKNGKLMVIR